MDIIERLRAACDDEAADTIEGLRADALRLRAALMLFAGEGRFLDRMAERIARAALEGADVRDSRQLGEVLLGRWRP